MSIFFLIIEDLLLHFKLIIIMIIIIIIFIIIIIIIRISMVSELYVTNELKNVYNIVYDGKNYLKFATITKIDPQALVK